jgi:hypothetical protein
MTWVTLFDSYRAKDAVVVLQSCHECSSKVTNHTLRLEVHIHPAGLPLLEVDPLPSNYGGGHGQVSDRTRTRAQCSMYKDVAQFDCISIYFGSSFVMKLRRRERRRRKSG